MLKDNMLAYSEINQILNLLEYKYREKVPTSVRNFFEEKRDTTYIPKIDASKPLNEQNLKKETLVILGILNLNYWCESEAEKNEFFNKLAENDKNRKELEEKYNPNNLFKNKVHSNSYKENMQMIEYKEKTIWQKILKLFKRK